METLTAIENVDVDEGKRPLEEIRMEEVVVFVDPFEEFLKAKAERDGREMVEEEIRRAGGREDDRTTWTGKRVRRDGVVEGEVGATGVGRYLDGNGGSGEGLVLEEWEREEPVKKKMKGGGGYGNFDSW